MCWINNDSQWNEQDKNVDACQEIAMFKRQAEMNYSTKYKNLSRWGIQAPKALMKVILLTTIHKSILQVCLSLPDINLKIKFQAIQYFEYILIFHSAKKSLRRETLAATTRQILR